MLRRVLAILDIADFFFDRLQFLQDTSDFRIRLFCCLVPYLVIPNPLLVKCIDEFFNILVTIFMYRVIVLE